MYFLLLFFSNRLETRLFYVYQEWDGEGAKHIHEKRTTKACSKIGWPKLFCLANGYMAEIFLLYVFKII